MYHRTHSDGVLAEESTEAACAVPDGELLTIRYICTGPVVVVLVVCLCEECAVEVEEEEGEGGREGGSEPTTVLVTTLDRKFPDIYGRVIERGSDSLV